MTLAGEQRGLLDLLKGREPAAPSPYLTEVAQSHGLRVLRWVALSWRELHIQSTCPLTVGLLKWQGTWRREMDAFNDGAHPSLAIEDLRDAFLEREVRTGDRLAAPLAALERALLDARARGPRAGTVEVAFGWDPEPVLVALLRGELTGDRDVRAGRFVARVGADVPGLLAIAPASAPAVRALPPSRAAR